MGGWFSTTKNSTTKCALYNASGNTIILKPGQNWSGQLKGSYPAELQDGEWAHFVHEGSNGEASQAAVVYRIKNTDEQTFDWMFAWYNQANNCETHAYTKIRAINHFTDWKTVNNDLIAAGKDDKDDTLNRFNVSVTITDDSSANFIAVISLHK